MSQVYLPSVSGGSSPTFTNVTATGQFLAANGSATVPSYSFSNSTNSGIYFVPNEVDITVMGSQSLRVGASAVITVTQLQLEAGLDIISGGMSWTYTATATSLALNNTEIIIGVTSTAAARTITLPNTGLVAGQRFVVKDESGAAATNNITISGNGANIDGAATKLISTNYGSVDLYFNGTNWFTI